MTTRRRDWLGFAWRFGAMSWVGASAPSAKGQLEELLESGRALIEERLDPEFLDRLRSGGSREWQSWLTTLAAELQGDNVIDLASLEDAADLVLPLVESSPETRAYGPWLRARLDYFDVAEFFRRTLPRREPQPGQPPSPPMTPTPEQERRAWRKQVENVPVPKRAMTWVPKLGPIFVSARAPRELVWLAEVESSFDPQARSPVGAVGMYQLMPRTAQELGLKTTPADERLVPEKNAKAAATYLVRLRRQFGDWRLALAAYNAGPGRVTETLKRRRARSFDAIAPDLPAETQMYVPKFEALLQKRERTSLVGLRTPA